MQRPRLTLADGVVGELSLDQNPSTLRHLDAALGAELPAAQRGLLLQLWRGVDPRRAADPAVAALVRRGLLAIKRGPGDPLLQRHLDRVCQPWRWCVPGPRARWQRLYRATLRAHARRKLLTQDFGQTPCLPETAVRRALACPPAARRVLCLGDDDLVAVPLALDGRRVVACDIDGTLLVPLERALAREGRLPLRAVVRDLTRAWPRAERDRYDAVFTDPMSTRACQRLFLSRAISALRPGGTIVSCIHAAALDVLDEVRRELRLELVAHHADFNRYLDENWSLDAFTSDLVVLARGPHSEAAVPADADVAADLFGELARHRAHAWCTLHTLRPVAATTLQRALHAVQATGWVPAVAWQRVDEAGAQALVTALAGGGQLSLSARPGRCELAFAVYPFDEARDAALLQVLLRALPGAIVRYHHVVPRPHQQVARALATTADRA